MQQFSEDIGDTEKHQQYFFSGSCNYNPSTLSTKYNQHFFCLEMLLEQNKPYLLI